MIWVTGTIKARNGNKSWLSSNFDSELQFLDQKFCKRMQLESTEKSFHATSTLWGWRKVSHGRNFSLFLLFKHVTCKL
uniref:Uncharacterized protein MANES_02G128600 n=1 Tax=Rhizophora mucronata TaxID=61149 RepID=A0A2P2MNT1_RHIMU